MRYYFRKEDYSCYVDVSYLVSAVYSNLEGILCAICNYSLGEWSERAQVLVFVHCYSF